MERIEQLQDPSIPVDYDTPCEGLAPPDLKWHLEYAMAFAMFGKSLDNLKKHPAFKVAEDLGDYVEAIEQLLSFRPHTSKAIEREAYERTFPEIDFSDLANPTYPSDSRDYTGDGPNIDSLHADDNPS